MEIKMNNRKIYFINKRLQTRIILKFVLMVIFWAVATVGVYTYLIEKKLDSIRYSSHVDITTTGELLLPITIGTHLFSLLIFAVMLAVVMRSIWKRLSPPLYSIKKDLSRIASGDLTYEVSLCKGEEFQDLASALDHMRREFRENIVRIKDQQMTLSAAAAEINYAISAGNLSMTHVVSLQSAVSRMREAVQKFYY
jgi:methyl-accepting chemotaxis protein